MNTQPVQHSPYDLPDHQPSQDQQSYEQFNEPQQTPQIQNPYDQYSQPRQQQPTVPPQEHDPSKEQYRQTVQPIYNQAHQPNFLSKAYSGRNKKRNIIITAAVIGVVVLAIALGAGLGAGLHKKSKKAPTYSNNNIGSGNGDDGSYGDNGGNSFSQNCTAPGSTSCVSNDDCAGFNSFCQLSCDGSSYCYT